MWVETRRNLIFPASAFDVEAVEEFSPAVSCWVVRNEGSDGFTGTVEDGEAVLMETLDTVAFATEEAVEAEAVEAVEAEAVEAVAVELPFKTLSRL